MCDSRLSCQTVEIIKNKLFWISSDCTPKNEPKTFFFNIDNDLIYEPFFSDFGPLDIGKTCKFALEVEKLLRCSQFANCRLYHHTSNDECKKANAAFLMGAFQILVLCKTAEEAWEPFEKSGITFAHFRDASMGQCAHKCSILDCLKGLEYAMRLRWISLKKFDIKCYEHYEKVENGDLNWIIPGKFVAFSGPSNVSKDEEGYRRLVPEDYISIFKKFNIKMVIRLNHKEYDESIFKKYGIKHRDFCFPDNSCPSDELLEEFIRACEEEKGAIAVHCKAGLGRTGTVIACYAMKHYKFPAKSLIGWTRLCRPGSILGKQQQFLINKEAHFHHLAKSSPIYDSLFDNGCETRIKKSDFGTEETKPSLKKEIKLKL